MKTKLLQIFLAMMILPMLALGAGLAAGDQTASDSNEYVSANFDVLASIRTDPEEQQNAYQVTQDGTYVVIGSLTGKLIVRARNEDLERLIPNNASIVSPAGPANYGQQADKVFMLPAEGA